MTNAGDAVGTVGAAIENAARLLSINPTLAAEQAREILRIVPNHPPATLLLGVSQRSLGDVVAAVTTLRALVDAQHRWGRAHYELGVTLGELDRFEEAKEVLQRAALLKPDLPDVWRALGDVLAGSGDASGADAAYASHIRASTRDPRLLKPAAALYENHLPEAETLLREHLRQYPTDVAAIRMLAEVAARLGRLDDSESLLESCLQLAPSFQAARQNFVVVLNRQNKPAAAMRQLEILLESEPRNPAYRNLKGVLLARIGDYSESIEVYSELLAAHPDQPKIWMSYGHALGTAGRTQDSVAAYRRCIGLAPSFGEAYWSLANLKTFRFTAREVEAMNSMLARPGITAEDRLHFHFALGKALEDAGSFAESFEHYRQGNEQRRATAAYFPEQTSSHVRASKQLFTREFFAARRESGSLARDPIFIVGLPRAGSTLLEQILASHSSVEGTMELPNIANLARSLGAKSERPGSKRYPAGLASVTPEQFRAMGDEYIEKTRIHRHSSKPHFIDKLPNNFLHIGLIHLILPGARIIDARRHPMACCFSAYKQHFARGQSYSYSLADLGRYYRDYVALMAHFDLVMPGKVHRVVYEAMVEDTEAETRRLLAFCGLPFEDQCLRFYENDRAVKTASAQQVRRPIFREGLEQWRYFEPWLGPLREALGTTLSSYPAVPGF